MKDEHVYTIRRLSELTGLTPHTLRYYEKAGLLRGIGRLENGHRIYTEEDLGWVMFLQQLRRTGMPIRGLQRFAELRLQGTAALPERRALLEQHGEQVQRQIQELQKSLAAINGRIARYRQLETGASVSGGESRKQPEPERMDAYYALRAAHYESIYHREEPKRQSELAALGATLRSALQGRRVLEVACGTGYWTERVGGFAKHVTAVDLTPETLEIAKRKPALQGPEITLLQGDAYNLDKLTGTFDGALAAFWLSHVPRNRISEFLDGWHSKLEPGAVVVLIDNMFLPDIGGELVRKPEMADSYKKRALPDGTEYLVLKNYFSEAELRQLFEPYS